MNSWCESCARKNQCYTIDIKPKCFVPITSNDRAIECKTEPSDSEKPNDCETCKHSEKEWYGLPCGSCKGFDMYEPKTEPQIDIHDLTDCDFCKDRNCKDCEGGKDEPRTDCSWIKGADDDIV